MALDKLIDSARLDGALSATATAILSKTGGSTPLTWDMDEGFADVIEDIPTQAAQTITPTTSNQTISSGTFLAGDQTILGDTNLIASNIASGISIFGVTGTFQGGGNLESITVDTTKLLSQSTTIEDGWVGTADLDGAFTSSSDYIFKNIENFNHILFKINTTYQIYGVITLQHDNGDQEIYNINGTYKVESSFNSSKEISFTWESSDCNQTFSTVRLNILSNNNIVLYFSGSYTGTLTGVNSSYLSFYVTGYDGYESITINLVDNPQFLNIYKSLAQRNTIISSAVGVSKWCNSFSSISSRQFAGQNFSGNFNFSNVTYIGQDAFAMPNFGGLTGAFNYWTATFPALINFSQAGAFALTRITEINCPLATSIGPSAFYTCTFLTTASFPECINIGISAFYYCQNLTTASFSKCTNIGNYAFYNCYKLTTASFPECTNIYDSAFYNCSSLTTASFSKCTSIGNYTFYNCYSLTTASFPECTSTGNYTFYNCSSLTTVSFPECTSIGISAFQNCNSLTTVSFSKCTNIGSYAFYNCYGLTTISFPECTIINYYAFRNCSLLAAISFPKCISISNYTFQGCSGLSQAYFMGSSIPSIGAYIFSSTPMALSTYLGYYGSIYVPASLLASYKTATNWATYSARMVGI